MKTRFTPLVKMKKDAMDKSERDLQKANHLLQNAQQILHQAYEELNSLSSPTSGEITQFVQARQMLEAQRNVVAQEQEKVAMAESEVLKAKMALKDAMMEYEKFKYLEAEQIKLVVAKRKKQMQRELDEIAVQNFGIRKES
ncbi:MAG: flagellar export protein FliJ [Sulfurimonadaceae bacterium]|nr:flagellar export protein FliJ [Sulfurimonadaceae bacterium]